MCLLVPLLLGCDGHAQETVVLKVVRGGEADAVRVFARSGLDAWSDILPRREGDEEVEFAFSATASYSYAVRCSGSDGRVRIQQFDALTVEERSPVEECNVFGRPQPSSTVVGSVVQPGSVAAGNRFAIGDVANWSFSLAAEAGLIDVLAASSDRVVLLPDVEVIDRVDLGTIDLARGGVALVDVPAQITEFVDGSLDVSTWLTTPRGTILRLADRDDRVIRAPAPDAARSLGRLTVQARTAEAGGRRRGVVEEYDGDAIALSLLPVLSDDVAVEERTGRVAVSTLPQIDHAFVGVTLADFEVARTLTTSAAWIELWNRDHLAFDLPTAFEGYEPRAEEVRVVMVSSTEPDGTSRWTSIDR